MDTLMAIAIFGNPAFISLIVLAVCILIGILVVFSHNYIDDDKNSWEAFEPLKYFCATAISILIISSSMVALPATFLDYQKYKLIRHYTDEEVVKEQLEPLVKGYLDAIQKAIVDPKFTIKVENVQK